MHADEWERLCVFQRPTTQWTATEWSVLWSAAKRGDLADVVYEGEGRVGAGRAHSFRVQILVPVWDPSMVQRERKFVEHPNVPPAQGGVNRRQRRRRKQQRAQRFACAPEEFPETQCLINVAQPRRVMAAIPKDPSAEFVAFLKCEKEKKVEALVGSFRKTVQEEADRRHMGKAW